MEFLCNNKKEREESTTLDLSFLNDSIVNHSASEFPFFFLSFFLSFIRKGGNWEICRKTRAHWIGYAQDPATSSRSREEMIAPLMQVESFSIDFFFFFFWFAHVSIATAQSLYATHLTFSGGNIIPFKLGHVYISTYTYTAAAVMCDCAAVVSMAGAAQHRTLKEHFQSWTTKHQQQPSSIKVCWMRQQRFSSPR